MVVFNNVLDDQLPTFLALQGQERHRSWVTFQGFWVNLVLFDPLRCGTFCWFILPLNAYGFHSLPTARCSIATSIKTVAVSASFLSLNQQPRPYGRALG